MRFGLASRRVRRGDVPHRESASAAEPLLNECIGKVDNCRRTRIRRAECGSSLRIDSDLFKPDDTGAAVPPAEFVLRTLKQNPDVNWRPHPEIEGSDFADVLDLVASAIAAQLRKAPRPHIPSNYWII
jgi:hypothetical protein